MGVKIAMDAALNYLNMGTLQGKTVAVQGLGNVGRPLVGFLLEAGVGRVVAADVSEAAVELAKKEFAGKPVEIRLEPAGTPFEKSVGSEQADIFSPCAFGGVLSDATVPLIKAKIVCGAANNQLLDPRTDSGMKARYDSSVICWLVRFLSRGNNAEKLCCCRVVQGNHLRARLRLQPHGHCQLRERAVRTRWPARQHGGPGDQQVTNLPSMTVLVVGQGSPTNLVSCSFASSSCTRHLGDAWENALFNITRRVLHIARTENITTNEAADKLADHYCAQEHPIWGHRTQAIIDALCEGGWAEGK